MFIFWLPRWPPENPIAHLYLIALEKKTEKVNHKLNKYPRTHTYKEGLKKLKSHERSPSSLRSLVCHHQATRRHRPVGLVRYWVKKEAEQSPTLG